MHFVNAVNFLFSGLKGLGEHFLFRLELRLVLSFQRSCLVLELSLQVFHLALEGAHLLGQLIPLSLVLGCNQ